MSEDRYRFEVQRALLEQDHLYFTRYFFKTRQSAKFIVNWHHRLISDTIQDVIDGKVRNVVINVAPGSSKTDLVVINLIARGLAINPRARFLHLSYSDDLASLNSSTARDIITSDEYQRFWPLKISEDSKSKKRWNVLIDGKDAGGVYATSLGGQITGFRAGHMTDGFQGAIIIDDPLKPEDAYSPSKLEFANRKLLTTVKSRKANPDTPIIIIMQRIAEKDCVGFIEKGNLGLDFKLIKIPALMSSASTELVPMKYHAMFDRQSCDESGRFSYWPYKEPLNELIAMEKGGGQDQTGARISRHVFATQYQQSPIAIGGNMIRGEWFVRYKIAPKIQYRIVFADTAQKTKEQHDYSVFQCWGLGVDKRIYLLDQIRGKWEAPELKRRAITFWHKHLSADTDMFGTLRKMMPEDKSSGTGLIQSIKEEGGIPVEGVPRGTDKVTRVMDAQPYIESGLVCLPETAPFTNDIITESEAFSADNSHEHDDQIDPMLDAVQTMLSSASKLRQWERLA